MVIRMHTKFKPHILEYLDSDVRYDGRKNEQFREIVVEKSIVGTAEGSARVKVGDTEVIAGIKMELGQPYPDTPEQGTIMIGAEFLPMASPDFESGPPGEEAVELARVVDRGIRESKALDFKKLCIKKGKKMWIVSIDVCTINDDGNLLDASALAAIAAIEDAVYPELIKDGDDYEIDYKHKSKTKLPLNKQPIAVTVHKMGKHILVDPNRDEEAKSESRLTVTSTQDGKLCALQKGGQGVLTIEDIGRMIDLALSKAGELRGKL